MLIQPLGLSSRLGCLEGTETSRVADCPALILDEFRRLNNKSSLTIITRASYPNRKYVETAAAASGAENITTKLEFLVQIKTEGSFTPYRHPNVPG
jgi:hypothetical protein